MSLQVGRAKPLFQLPDGSEAMAEATTSFDQWAGTRQ